MMLGDQDSFSLDFDGQSFLRAPISVYLAGPLTDLSPEEEADCSMVREVLWDELRRCPCAHFAVYDPFHHTAPGSFHDPQKVFEIDYQATIAADLVVFHVNTKSLGVGVEGLAAAIVGVPRVLVHPEGAAISRMFLGLFNPTVATIAYASADDLRQGLRAKVTDITDAAKRSGAKRRPVFEQCIGAQLGAFVLGERITSRMAIGSLAQETDIGADWLACLERNDVLAPGISLAQLGRLAQALGCSVEMDGLTPKLKSRIEPSHVGRESMANLVEWVRSKKFWVEDEDLFRMWSTFEESQDAVRGRKDLKPWSVADWEGVYASPPSRQRKLFDELNDLD